MQKEIGNLQEIKIDIDKPALLHKNSNSVHNNYMDTHRTLSNAGQSLLNFEKVKPDKQALINRI